MQRRESGAQRAKLPEVDRTVGRPGMELWRILVLGVLKQGLACDFDRLHDLANHHQTIRSFLGHSDFGDETYYEYQTVVDNVSLLTAGVCCRRWGVWWWRAGTRSLKKSLASHCAGRCDSFVVETNVHYPTDVSLLWDAMRCLLREDRAGGKAARGWWLASVAASVELGPAPFQPGTVDAPGEAPSGAGGGVSGALRGAGRAGSGHVRHVAGPGR